MSEAENLLILFRLELIALRTHVAIMTYYARYDVISDFGKEVWNTVAVDQSSL